MLVTMISCYEGLSQSILDLSFLFAGGNLEDRADCANDANEISRKGFTR
jgi:hypothetical protein